MCVCVCVLLFGISSLLVLCHTRSTHLYKTNSFVQQTSAPFSPFQFSFFFIVFYSIYIIRIVWVVLSVQQCIYDHCWFVRQIYLVHLRCVECSVYTYVVICCFIIIIIIDFISLYEFFVVVALFVYSDFVICSPFIIITFFFFFSFFGAAKAIEMS